MKGLRDSILNAQVFLEEAVSEAEALGLSEAYELLGDALSDAEDALASVPPE